MRGAAAVAGVCAGGRLSWGAAGRRPRIRLRWPSSGRRPSRRGGPLGSRQEPRARSKAVVLQEADDLISSFLVQNGEEDETDDPDSDSAPSRRVGSQQPAAGPLDVGLLRADPPHLVIPRLFPRLFPRRFPRLFSRLFSCLFSRLFSRLLSRLFPRQFSRLLSRLLSRWAPACFGRACFSPTQVGLAVRPSASRPEEPAWRLRRALVANDVPVVLSPRSSGTGGRTAVRRKFIRCRVPNLSAAASHRSCKAPQWRFQSRKPACFGPAQQTSRGAKGTGGGGGGGGGGLPRRHSGSAR